MVAMTIIQAVVIATESIFNIRFLIAMEKQTNACECMCKGIIVKSPSIGRSRTMRRRSLSLTNKVHQIKRMDDGHCLGSAHH